MHGGVSTANFSADGGDLQLLSGGIPFTVNNARFISVEGGDGALILNHGTIFIDQVDVSPIDGLL
jgi:hypothetical protein